jgi:hypothetical protein
MKWIDELTAGNQELTALFFGALLGGTIFGGLHCLAWNFHFPTHREALGWRICSVATTALPIMSSFPIFMWLKLHPSEGLEDWARRSKLLLEKRGEREQLEREWVERPEQIKQLRREWAEQAERIKRLEDEQAERTMRLERLERLVRDRYRDQEHLKFERELELELERKKQEQLKLERLKLERLERVQQELLKLKKEQEEHEWFKELEEERLERAPQELLKLKKEQEEHEWFKELEEKEQERREENTTRHLGNFGETTRTWLRRGMAFVCVVVFLVPYILARLFLLVEVFRTLGFLPPDAFVDTWSGSLPHFG